jgi:GT2 family glycosyltransferase
VSDPGITSKAGTGDIGLAREPPGTHPGDAAAVTMPIAIVVRPTVSVIVCGFTEDRWDDLCRAVRSLREQTEPAQEIILVVDHCPGLLRRARENLAGLTIVPNRRAKGLAGGRNTGVAEARGDVVAFIDDDAAADPDWLARLADHYLDARVMGVGGLVKPVFEAGRPPWFPPELDWVVGCSYQGMPVRSAPVRNFIGANMSFRREIVTDLHGFSVGLGRVGTTPLGCEETELCLRVSRHHPDGVLLYEPAASVDHRVREQRARWGYLWSRCYAEGLSKARVARLAGTGRALASERSYVRATIPRGVGRSLLSVARGRPEGLLSALALVSAVMVTSAGYIAGQVAERRSRDLAAPAEGSWARRARHWAVRSPLVPWTGLALAVTLWGVSLAQVNIATLASAGLGLTPLLPVTFWAAAGVLTVSFCAAVVRRASGWPVLTGHLLALVAILHATPAILYGTLRYSWAWKHIGVIDFISHHGIDFHLGGVLGVYQGWPGFFALGSFLTTAAGQSSALSYASWALPVNDLLWLGPLILIARAFTSDWRFIWTAAWLFELGNWVGQDYFSPQAFSFFLYLTVIAICLRWLWDPRPPAWAWPPAWARRPAWSRRPARTARAASGVLAPASDGAPRADLADTVADGMAVVDVPPVDVAPMPSRSTRFVLVVCLLPLMAAMASSHQLTPFMLISALTLLAVFRQVRPWVLPVIMTVITAGWILYGALPWLEANASQVFAGFGLLWANTSSHIVGGTQVPFDQVLVKWDARFLTVVIGALAVIGFFRYRRRHDRRARRSWNRAALLAVAALPAVAANSYGGEVIFRVFVFALPFMAVTAAAAFFPHPGASRPRLAGIWLAGVSLILVATFTVANYGQEAINYFTPQEVAAARWLYRTAPRGAEIVSANSNFPWAFVHYNWYPYAYLDYPAAVSRDTVRAPVQTVMPIMQPPAYAPASYLILTRSQAEEESLTGNWPPGAFDRITSELLASGRFRVVYRNADAMILQLQQRSFQQSAPLGVLAPGGSR